MKQRNNGSRIFMTELMFSIFFFIIIATICLQCFAQSYAKSKDAKNLTQAVGIVSNAAELYLSSNLNDDFTNYYDEDWNEIEGEGVYKLTGIITEADDLGVESMSLRVSTMDDEEEIYSLVVEKAVQGQ